MNVKYFQWKSTKHEKIPKPNRGEIFSRSKKFQVGPKKKNQEISKQPLKNFKIQLGKTEKNQIDKNQSVQKSWSFNKDLIFFSEEKTFSTKKVGKLQQKLLKI